MATDTTNANQIDSANRRVIVWCSVALVVLIGFFTLLTDQFVADGPRKDTQGQLTEQGGAKPHIIPRPNEGKAPEEPGDRGGWAQLALLGLIVASVGGIGFAVVRGSRASRAGRAGWLAAADSPEDGVLDKT